MKKKFILPLVVLGLSSVLVVGCSKPAENTEEVKQEEVKKEENKETNQKVETVGEISTEQKEAEKKQTLLIMIIILTVQAIMQIIISRMLPKTHKGK